MDKYGTLLMGIASGIAIMHGSPDVAVVALIVAVMLVNNLGFSNEWQRRSSKTYLTKRSGHSYSHVYSNKTLGGNYGSLSSISNYVSCHCL